VTHLLNSALEADDDPLTAAEAKELTDAAKEAVAEATEREPALPTTDLTGDALLAVLTSGRSEQVDTSTCPVCRPPDSGSFRMSSRKLPAAEFPERFRCR
jgi:hypothetical protein